MQIILCKFDAEIVIKRENDLNFNKHFRYVCNCYYYQNSKGFVHKKLIYNIQSIDTVLFLCLRV